MSQRRVAGPPALLLGPKGVSGGPGELDLRQLVSIEL